MKKILLFVAALMTAMCAMAQEKFYVYMSDGNTKEYAVAECDSLNFIAPPALTSPKFQTALDAGEDVQYKLLTATYAGENPQYPLQTVQKITFETTAESNSAFVVNFNNGDDAEGDNSLLKFAVMPDVTVDPAEGTLTTEVPELTITASSQTEGVTYKWSTGEETASITVSEAGTYTATVTAPNGVTNSASSVITSIITSVESAGQAAWYEVYANDGIINVRFTDGQEHFMCIGEPSGKILSAVEKCDGKQFAVPAGTYIVYMENQAVTINVK
ncbi:MAG: PKD domain-containing protein [Paludibacteraceae bacterium]|nr:PKD domain-containing protein [Paludibacteraceae bacterium]